MSLLACVFLVFRLGSRGGCLSGHRVQVRSKAVARSHSGRSKDLMGEVYSEIEGLVSDAAALSEVTDAVMDCVRKGIRKTTKRALS